MKKKVLWLMIGIIIVSNSSFAQTANISETQVPLLTYPFSDPDPVPAPSKFYPYFRFEGYSDKGAMRNWKMIVMENDYIKLWVAPEIGGKIWGAIEKATGKEFIYFNHVVKFRDVAMRGPWTSGGVELNFGVIGHAPTTSSPVDYMTRKNEDGSVSCFVGAIDLPSRTRWSVEINLPKDKAYFTTRSVWDNPTNLEQSYYHWMNLGIKTAGNLEYVFPGNYHLGHDGAPASWPVDQQGRQISWYEKNNFGSYKSYHVFGGQTGFYGAYWHDDDFGFVHYASYDDKPGKKVWIWGLSDEGMIWEKLLTDKDGQYTEIQSGRLFNQAADQSSNTPFKNRGFAPVSTDEWTEYWFPVKKTQGLKFATPAGSVNLEQKGKTLNLWFCPNEKLEGNLEVRNGKQVVFSKKIVTIPMQVVSESFEYQNSASNLSVWINNWLLYETDPAKGQLKRPVEPAKGFNWESAYGWSLKGKEQERQRLYKAAYEDYKKSLSIEPNFVPSLNGMSALAYRKTDFQEAFSYASKALSVDTYDADANLNYGNAAFALGDTISAIDGYSLAASSVSQRAAAYSALSSISLANGDFQQSLLYANKSLEFNQLSSEANQLKVISLRKLGNSKEAFGELSKMESKDPLNHFIWFEKYLATPSPDNKTKAINCVTNELPQETYLEYALWYYGKGQTADALKILGLAPENKPVVLLWEAYLSHMAGNQQLANSLLTKAISIDPQFVLPFRTETLKPLEWALKISNDWKIKYYTGLIYLNAGAQEKGVRLWKDCKNEPSFFPFYIARTELWAKGSTEAQADVEKALKLAGSDWRTGLFASRFFFEKGNPLKAEELAKDFYAKNPLNYYLGLHYAKMLQRNGNYSACVSLLQKIAVLPNEGATEGRTIWRFANIGKALDEMKTKNFKKALESIGMARQWPFNLGVGKPYLVDESLEYYIAYQAYTKLKDKKSAETMDKNIILALDKQEHPADVHRFLSALIFRKNGNQTKADQIMKEMLEKNPTLKLVQWSQAYYYNKTEEAMNIAKQVDDNDVVLKLLIRSVGLD